MHLSEFCEVVDYISPEPLGLAIGLQFVLRNNGRVRCVTTLKFVGVIVFEEEARLLYKECLRHGIVFLC